ncbi:hypothetical protein C8Q70DRAFT_260168 [Cubamyces menziesii]|nr:hypothetical protein C8Q70DRAFT_260168 [Cubamyces menziesii]
MWGSKNSLRRIASLATVDLPFPFPFSSQSPSLSGRRSTANGAAASTHPDRSPHDSLDAHGQQPSPMQSHRVQRMPRDVSSLRSQNGLEMCGRWDLPHYALSFPACGADACGLARNIGPECERVCNEAASSQDYRGVHHPILSATVESQDMPLPVHKHCETHARLAGVIRSKAHGLIGCVPTIAPRRADHTTPARVPSWREWCDPPSRGQIRLDGRGSWRGRGEGRFGTDVRLLSWLQRSGAA